jgi:signal transduction histidine kinase
VTVADRRLAWLGTVRWRVTLIAAFAVALVLVVAGAVLVVVQRRVLTDQLDETLTADADRVVASIETEGEPDLRMSTDDDAVAQIVTADGEVIFATATPTATQGPIVSAPEGTGHVARTISGERVVSRRFESGGRDLVVHVAAPLDDVEESVSALILTLAVSVPLVTAILAAVVWLLVGRTLRPVERIRTEVAGIGLRELNRRVPQPAGHDEIARLAGTMNEMLERLDVSNQQQQRFVADASHELRTPLARIRAELEVGRHGDASVDEAVVASVLEEVDGLQRLTDDLLVLARSDAGVSDSDGRPVDLDDVVLEEVRTRPPTTVTVDTRRVSAAQVLGHRDQLRRVVANLLDNAVRHATRMVTLSLGERDGVVTFAVADDGPGIPPERRVDVFERFRRVDDARAADRGGTGLGLAIARDLVEQHGGEISVDPAYDAGARFIVTLPATGT